MTKQERNAIANLTRMEAMMNAAPIKKVVKDKLRQLVWNIDNNHKFNTIHTKAKHALILTQTHHCPEGEKIARRVLNEVDAAWSLKGDEYTDQLKWVAEYIREQIQ